MVKIEDIKIIKPGTFVEGMNSSLKKLIDKKKFKEEKISEIGSTVTLIKSNKNILVDCGMQGEKDAIIEGLKKEGLEPKDIDILVITHLHVDHFFNCSLFDNATCYISGIIKQNGKEHPSKMQFKDKLKLCKDVFLLNTSGIEQFHCSVLVKTNKGNVIVAGDAITFNKDIDLNVKHKAWDSELYDSSRRQILSLADYIIPGHGDHLISVDKRKQKL